MAQYLMPQTSIDPPCLNEEGDALRDQINTLQAVAGKLCTLADDLAEIDHKAEATELRELANDLGWEAQDLEDKFREGD